MDCPRCGNPKAEPEQHEVDIGIGVQTCLFGCACPVCGQLACCLTCGAWDFQPHAAWCGDAPGN